MEWKRIGCIAVLGLALSACGGGGGGGGDEEMIAVQETRVDQTLIPVHPQEEMTWDHQGGGIGIAHFYLQEEVGVDPAFTLHLNLGDIPKDVYFVFTQPRLNDVAESPSLSTLGSVSPQDELRQAEAVGDDLTDWARREGVGLEGSPEISLFNSDPWTFAGLDRDAPPSVGALSLEVWQPQFDAVGDKEVFRDQKGNPVPATCRHTISADGKLLNLWVADDAWSGAGCRKSRCVTQEMVEQLGARFLAPGKDNDIYNWITGIFGAEWGNSSYRSLIPKTDQFTILLLDIDGDNSTSGGLLGYFYARDNFKASAIPDSNERLMFAIDSVLFANDSGYTWDITDYWPTRLLGTLAHEFQHMIHYYQKGVLRGVTRSDTWLNEMCSEVAVDLISSRAGIPGPRGIDPTKGQATHPYYSSPLTRFNYYNYLSLTRWMDGGVFSDGDQNVLNSYGLAYAFGAYLVRNYGGAEFFKEIVQNGYGDYRAVDEALSKGGYSETFSSALQKWGVAVLLSDLPGSQVPLPYRYNAGDFIEAGREDLSLPLGSVNLYNYSFYAIKGPLIYDELPLSQTIGRYPASNVYLRVGSGLTGEILREVTLPAGVRLSVVAR